MKYHCKTCGYKGSKVHNHIYDCCDYLDKEWMKKWMMNLKKKEQQPYESNFVRWSKNLKKLF